MAKLLHLPAGSASMHPVSASIAPPDLFRSSPAPCSAQLPSPSDSSSDSAPLNASSEPPLCFAAPPDPNAAPSASHLRSLCIHPLRTSLPPNLVSGTAELYDSAESPLTKTSTTARTTSAPPNWFSAEPVPRRTGAPPTPPASTSFLLRWPTPPPGCSSRSSAGKSSARGPPPASQLRSAEILRWPKTPLRLSAELHSSAQPSCSAASSPPDSSAPLAKSFR
ncbi:mucin-7-like [Rosa chinensis]|uniref:mucin-7-like n=1 Tax=Rosa chinensis TaxID=74649 RepID=UPI000D08DBE3|nr:mucin-7-like [Rosa chinensis]